MGEQLAQIAVVRVGHVRRRRGSKSAQVVPNRSEYFGEMLELWVRHPRVYEVAGGEYYDWAGARRFEAEHAD